MHRIRQLRRSLTAPLRSSSGFIAGGTDTQHNRYSFHFNPLTAKPAKVIAAGFALVILIGTLLLMLPFASREPGSASFLDALFTATTSTCVTGLIVHDTYSYWTLFGQLVILFLIQTGGLGFMTIMMYIFGFTHHRIGLAERSVMQESISAPGLGGIVRMGRFAFLSALVVEATGAILLALRFVPEMGWGKGLYYAVFHSISAFCNAGIDLMGFKTPYTSLTTYSADPLVSGTVMGLIVVGGLGFVVWSDILQHKLRFREYMLHTKVVLVTTAILILSGAVLIFAFEFNGSAFEGMGLGEKILCTFFQSVTPRTAGFNTVDIAKLSDPSVNLITALMLIGGAPGSTAGGFKVTSFAMIALCVLSVLKKRASTECFGRRIEDTTIKKALTIMVIYFVVALAAATVMTHIEPVTLEQAMFETSSAIGTVGLTMGITSSLSAISRVMLILLMYCGRVGCMTVAYLLVAGLKEQSNHLPVGKIAVG